jgi:hypothetical protein
MNPSRTILANADIPEADKVQVGILWGYILNTTPGWRPSDAMDWAIRIYNEGGLQAVADFRK